MDATENTGSEHDHAGAVTGGSTGRMAGPHCLLGSGRFCAAGASNHWVTDTGGRPVYFRGRTQRLRGPIAPSRLLNQDRACFRNRDAATSYYVVTARRTGNTFLFGHNLTGVPDETVFLRHRDPQEQALYQL